MATTLEQPRQRNWSSEHTTKARQIWEEYQRMHDVSDRKGKAAGIEPISGRVWFGESALEIGDQMRSEGMDRPFYAIRVGHDYYQCKGGRR